MLLPMPVRVWRYKLQPLSVGHYCLLSRVGTTVGQDAKLPGPGDLALMLWIVSRPWQKAVNHLGGWRQRTYCRFMAWMFNQEPKLFKQVLFEFLNYWQFQNETWNLWKTTNEESSGEEKTSHIQAILWILASEWGYNHGEIMDIPWKLAVSDAFGCLVIKDKMKIVSKESLDRRAWVEKQMGVKNGG